MAKRTPHVFRNIWNNFLQSLKPRPTQGNFMGEDYKGTRYYEIPPDPSIGKRKPLRSYLPRGGEAFFDDEIPAEWMAWLRYIRKEPPTKEEIERNLAIAEMKKKNAAILEAKADEERRKSGRELTKDIKGFDSFPSYEEYHGFGGESKKKS